jgi:hypothetical protein
MCFNRCDDAAGVIDDDGDNDDNDDAGVSAK